MTDFQFLHRHHKAVSVNFFIIIFLIAYTLFGGFVFLHFEYNYAQYVKYNESIAKKECIEKLLTSDKHSHSHRHKDSSNLALDIVNNCFYTGVGDSRYEWSFKSACLYGLGYGKVEPRTLNARVFTVIYGFIGIPLTVILLTNLGRYIEVLAINIKKLCFKVDEEESDTVSGRMLFIMVMLYLVIGASFIPLLHDGFDFFNGLYFAFICLTAIEYGDLVTTNDFYIPIVIIYVCIGLAISTIALDIGNLYVRKLHYIGRKLKNIANIRIWFGAKNLEVRELMNAIGQNIGIEQSVMEDIDLDMLIKDGQFPLFVDSEDDLMDIKPKKSVVRFEDEVTSDIDDTFNTYTISEPTNVHTSSRLSPPLEAASQIHRRGGTDNIDLFVIRK
ncbi:hypothetical protein WR25_19348 [Diploscapter pachys]|uniref:Potassium channel domain-containing protein n=1 Tax=Diploscapter pachys TaxID=2018661 RepID=A0A2A2K2T9_9BILA|nr:hypothetical protein WR25_19348 [Diploscapter pachys]